MFRYFAGFVATISLIILLIVLIFHGGGKPKVPSTSRTLDSYASTDAEASLTIDGPIVADQNYQSEKITVSNDSATFEQINGYQGSVANLKSYPNNTGAYSNFLFALEHAGFTNGDTSSSLKDDRGYCSTGDRYIFEFDQDGQQIERFWATSCGGTKTYKGNLNLTLTLFERQIPDYNTLSNNLNL